MMTQINHALGEVRPSHGTADIVSDPGQHRETDKLARLRLGIDAVVAAHLPHPFITRLTAANAERVARHFLAISLGFPYAQAGSQLALMHEFIESNRAPRTSVEITTAVGNFLSWDETGGHWAVLRHGNAGLPGILRTDTHFHGNMLKRDLKRIFGKPIEPDFSITGPYLKDLCSRLSSSDDVLRCATMVSFERHAELVITALWQRLVEIFHLAKDDYAYFTTHVGGEDPAEAYHIRMTGNMVDRIVSERHAERFIAGFEDSFLLHIRWSSDISA